MSQEEPSKSDSTPRPARRLRPGSTTQRPRVRPSTRPTSYNHSDNSEKTCCVAVSPFSRFGISIRAIIESTRLFLEERVDSLENGAMVTGAGERTQGGPQFINIKAWASQETRSYRLLLRRRSTGLYGGTTRSSDVSFRPHGFEQGRSVEPDDHEKFP